MNCSIVSVNCITIYIICMPLYDLWFHIHQVSIICWSIDWFNMIWTNDAFLSYALQCVIASNGSYHYAVLLGTHCSMATIVPVPLKHSNCNAWPTLHDMLLDLWIKSSETKHQSRCNLPPYQIYSSHLLMEVVHVELPLLQLWVKDSLCCCWVVNKMDQVSDLRLCAAYLAPLFAPIITPAISAS